MNLLFPPEVRVTVPAGCNAGSASIGETRTRASGDMVSVGSSKGAFPSKATESMLLQFPNLTSLLGSMCAVEGYVFCRVGGTFARHPDKTLPQVRTLPFFAGSCLLGVMLTTIPTLTSPSHLG